MHSSHVGTGSNATNAALCGRLDMAVFRDSIRHAPSRSAASAARLACNSCAHAALRRFSSSAARSSYGTKQQCYMGHDANDLALRPFKHAIERGDGGLTRGGLKKAAAEPHSPLLNQSTSCAYLRIRADATGLPVIAKTTFPLLRAATQHNAE